MHVNNCNDFINLLEALDGNLGRITGLTGRGLAIKGNKGFMYEKQTEIDFSKENNGLEILSWPIYRVRNIIKKCL